MISAGVRSSTGVKNVKLNEKNVISDLDKKFVGGFMRELYNKFRRFFDDPDNIDYIYIILCLALDFVVALLLIVWRFI